MRMFSAVILLALVWTVTGCRTGGAAREERLDGQAIMPGRGRLPTEPYSPVDQPGALPYDEFRDQPQRPAPTGDEDGAGGSSELLEGAVRPLAEPFDQTGPTTRGSGAASRPAAAPGVYMTIGGVVAEVNSVPIYADKIVSDIEPHLAAKARSLSEHQFRAFAADELRKQLTENIQSELLFAAANRLLDDDDKEQARYFAELWRKQAITKAGGSIEMARRVEMQRGRDFDKLVIQAYREALSRRLLQKRIFPQIQVTAAEMRQYYEANREKLYTVRDAAQFEVIEIDPVKVGGEELAKQKIQDLRAKAVAGEDFAELAKFSTGRQMRSSEGELPWIDRKAFHLPAVEEAVWNIQPGEVTPVVEEGGRYYIAKLERKQPARVMPFEEAATQADIEKKLREQKFRPLYDRMLQDLQDKSIVRTDPEMLQAALEIAMQRYHQWAGK